MTFKRCKRAGFLRDIWFWDDRKNIHGMWVIMTPDGLFRADTLAAIYREIMRYPVTWPDRFFA